MLSHRNVFPTISVRLTTDNSDGYLIQFTDNGSVIVVLACKQHEKCSSLVNIWLQKTAAQ